MKKPVVRICLLVLALALAVPGIVLYLASYFWSAWLLLGAACLAALERVLTVGPGEAAGQARAFLSKAATPVEGVCCALLIGAAIMAATGHDPISSYGALFYGGLVKNWAVSVLNATPLVFTALAVAIAFHGGLFNIGAEGQYYVGVIVATWLGLLLHLPPILSLPLIFMAGAVAGALANAIPAWLKVRTGAHEVVTTMMFAYAISTLSPIFIRAHGGDPSMTDHPGATDTILQQSQLPVFKSFLPLANYRLHIGVLIAIGLAILVRFLLARTNLGFKIRATGFNPVAARMQGISVAGITVASLMISGAVAALSGVTQVVGLDHRMYQNLSAGYGWNGISVALLARNNPVAIIFASLLWGILDAGGQYMARTAQTPNAIIEIVKGVILFLMLAEYLWSWLSSHLRRKRAVA
ncbi:MAG TPA: ABC transporter permease [Spirochaetia bacterium]|nr:ABC transporter permease [Spirochaetia bacterium]